MDSSGRRAARGFYMGWGLKWDRSQLGTNKPSRGLCPCSHVLGAQEDAGISRVMLATLTCTQKRRGARRTLDLNSCGSHMSSDFTSSRLEEPPPQTHLEGHQRERDHQRRLKVSMPEIRLFPNILVFYEKS